MHRSASLGCRLLSAVRSMVLMLMMTSLRLGGLETTGADDDLFRLRGRVDHGKERARAAGGVGRAGGADGDSMLDLPLLDVVGDQAAALILMVSVRGAWWLAHRRVTGERGTSLSVVARAGGATIRST
jgi:hypothetical protein